MKDLDAAEVFSRRPKVYAIFRITDKKCPLIKSHKFRVGDEFAMVKDSLGYLAFGPLELGTVTKAPNAQRWNPGSLKHWSFMEFRVAYANRVEYVSA